MRVKQPPPHATRLPGDGDFLDPTHAALRILNLVHDAVVAADEQQTIVLFNQRAEAMFGYRAEEVLSKPLALLLAEGRKEFRWRRKNGSEFLADSSRSDIPWNGRSIWVYILQDITPPTVTEERLLATLREKNVLIEEVHHRVKNNLQVITSLLGLQARTIKDPATRKNFEESRYRVQAMAILHEILYESSSLTEIDFADYIRRLVEHLGRSYGAASRIRTEVRLEALQCHRDVALPCGLIVNELLSNAFKYAFPEGQTGNIRVALRRGPLGKAHLMVRDNGVGLPPGLDWNTSPTLGLRLVRTLARQIDAEVKTSGRAGTLFSITFLDGLPIPAD
ncbi:MAG TPA: histidine kinase dimerization/phosphoacceptor domain -containing protein [Bryobacteraceae bacterium]|nr:histidine kinase dimerization/phosphoacceptor domain -containing protein [Bryobacteraceae bacterium]